MITKVRILKAKIKDKLTTTVTVPCFAPGPCPKCGAPLEVPLTRQIEEMTCFMCKSKLKSCAIGLINADEDKLKQMWSEVRMWVEIGNADEKYDA